jgi:phosphatidylglycerol:prolipoprotein diacylglycerol transferase
MIVPAAALGAGAGVGPDAIPPPLVVIFDFDPIARFAGIEVRWQILAIAVVVLGTILLGAVVAFVAQHRRDAAEAAQASDEADAPPETLTIEPPEADAPPETLTIEPPEADAPPETPSEAPSESAPGAEDSVETHEAARRPAAAPVGARLRLDDLLFIVIAGVAGAVVGGRLGYVLLHLDYYRANTNAILDPSQGSLTLAGGLAVGVISALLVAAVLGSPVRRWLGVAIVPLLIALCLGKLSMVLGGEGQGLPSGGEWASAYLGPGPWGSLAPKLPSESSQVYEAATAAGALVVVLLLALVGPLRRRPVILFSVGIALWALGRFAVAFTWRDPAPVGSLNGDQVVTLGIAVVCGLAILGSIGAKVRERRATAVAVGDLAAGPDPAGEADLLAAGIDPEDAIEMLPADMPHPVDAPVILGGDPPPLASSSDGQA